MNNQIQLVLKSSTTELSLNDHELGIYLTPELDGLTGLPEIRTTSGVNAGYDGGWTSAQNYDARSITIRGVIANEDVATVEQLRRQLTTLAGQGKNEELTLDLVTQAGKAYTIQVRTIALEMSLQKVLTQQEFMLQLRADDPLIYDASETTHEALLQVAQATGGFTIDFELPLAITGSSEETVVNNGGLEQVPTITRMYGALHNPKLINQTTNQSMQIMADLGFAEGDWTTPSEPVEGKDLTINGAPENAPLSDFQLKGNTEQSGEPTPDTPVPVKVVTGENVVKVTGKNIFKPSENLHASRNGLTNVVNDDGSITTSGKPTVNWNAIVYPSVDITDRLEDGATYTVSQQVKTNKLYLQVSVRDKNTGTAQYIALNNATSASFTVDKSLYTYSYIIQSPQMTTWGDDALTITNYYQLEKSSQATDWEAYQEQSYPISLGSIELCGLTDDHRDHIFKNADKWYIHKEIGKYVLTGASEENWFISGQALKCNYLNALGYPDMSSEYSFTGSLTTQLYSNYGLVAPSARIYNGSASGVGLGYKGGGGGTTDAIYVSKGSITAVGDWRALLTATPLICYYALATPTDTEITNQALIAQLEAILQEAKMYNPQTNITTLYAAGNEQGTLSISYFTDKNPDTRDELVIDSRLRTITLNGLDVYHLQAPGSEFLMLAPGENRLALQSDITGDNGYAQVSYKQGYLSI